jgi:hypothetical protein
MIDVPCLIVADRCFNLGPVDSGSARSRRQESGELDLFLECYVYENLELSRVVSTG